jgi:hypothetical protein
VWFTPTFLQRTYQLSVAEAGRIVGPIHLLGGSLGLLGTAYLMSRPRFIDSRRVVRFLFWGFVIATIPSFIAFYTHTLLIAKIMLWMFIPAIYIYIGPTFALLQNLAPPHMRATFIAISLFGANVLNLIAAPELVGSLSDHFAGVMGPDASSLRSALLLLAPTGLWTAYHFFRSERDLLENERHAGTLRGALSGVT